MSPKILISSCLAGNRCAYDGKARLSEGASQICTLFDCIDVCPEMEGGLTSPRQIHEIAGGTGDDVWRGKARVVSHDGKDRTEYFKRGAKKTLEKALKYNASIAVMKERSPSCGLKKIHAGSFNGTLRGGSGVTTALLLKHGIKVFTEDEIEKVKTLL